MIIRCYACSKWFDDEWRLKICPHAAFNANNGDNTFQVNEKAYLSEKAPQDRESTEYY